MCDTTSFGHHLECNGAIKQCRDQGQVDREKYTYTQADERTHGDTDTDSQTYRQHTDSAPRPWAGEKINGKKR